MLWLGGCASAVDRNRQFASEHDLERHVIQGEGFKHVVYFNQAATLSTRSWHVYIEGDGRPWVSHQFVANDPTAPLPLMLRLVSNDPAAAIYIARPCYEGMVNSAACMPWYWSEGRYSKSVVDSMVSALQTLVEQYHISSLTLIGHSGGGTLAMLMAPLVAGVDKLVTISGNLDTRAWTQKHGYSPLNGSMNPATENPIPETIAQFHFLGSQDKNIPLGAVRTVIARKTAANVTMVDRCGHTDCWENYFNNKILKIIHDK